MHVKRKKTKNPQQFSCRNQRKVRNTSTKVFLFDITVIKQLISVLERASEEIRFQMGLMRSLILKAFLFSPLQPEGVGLSVTAPALTEAPQGMGKKEVCTFGNSH